MNPRWLMWMSRWARNPPSRQFVMLVLGVIGFAVVLYGVEQIWGWPEALTPAGGGRPARPHIQPLR